MPEFPPGFYWIWGAGLGVTLVVFVPLSVYQLHVTFRAARSVQRYAADALVAAAGIAGHTPHVKALDATIATATEVLVAAGEVDKKLGAIADVLGERAR